MLPYWRQTLGISRFQRTFSNEGAIPRSHHSDIAKGILVADDLPHLGGARVVDPHGGVHELDPGGVAGAEDGVELGGAERGGLLEEQMLATHGDGWPTARSDGYRL